MTQYQDRALTPMVRKKLGRGRKNRCRFCTKEGCPRPAFVDYKDVQTLKKLCTSQGKMFSRKRSGNCAAFQRAVKDAVKRARFMALHALRRRVNERGGAEVRPPRYRLSAAGEVTCCRACARGRMRSLLLESEDGEAELLTTP